jgi:iron(III) transport system ATP-binding protein
VIALRGLAKVFQPPRGLPVEAVAGIDLEARRGEFLVLLGPSGCGKTTTLRCVAGLERATAGSVEIDGAVVDDARRFIPPERRDIGMVFQSYAVWPHLSVFENVALPLTQGQRRVARTEVAPRVHAALELVRLEAQASRPVTELSGGQQQRVALARAIVTRPKVLLMDEPLSNLDARLRDSMRTELARLADALGVTTLYVTHDQIEALGLGDRICVMRAGRILQQGTPEEVYASPADTFVAQFVGDMNFVSGTVRADGGVDTALGPIACSASAAAGSAVTLGMRPERVSPADANGAGPSDVIEGVLRARTFLGETTVLQVEASGTSLVAKVRGSPGVAIGERVRLHLPRDAWRVFAEERPAPRS